MRERKNGIESDVYKDLRDQMGDIKEVLINLKNVLSMGYDNLAQDTDCIMGILGISVLVLDSVNEEFDIMVELLETIE